MVKVPATVQKRLKAEIPKFQKILSSALSRDVNEADTVIIITDILEKVFGFNKYEEITREYAISGTYVDLAVVTGKKINYLVEVKAIGIPLKESHLRQAINYAAKEGVKWTVLTNGVEWEIHRITVDGQVTNQEIVKFNFLDISVRTMQDLEILFLLCKKGMGKDLIGEFYEHKQIFNRYTIGSILITDDVLNVIKRTLRKISPSLKINNDELRVKITENILKRDILDSAAGKEAQKQVKKSMVKISRKKLAQKKVDYTDVG